MRKALALLALLLIPLALAANPGHLASRIGPGEFETGNYTFPEDLFINGSLHIGDLSANRTNASIHFGRAGNQTQYLLFNESEGTDGRFVFSRPLRVPGSSPAITFYSADDPGNQTLWHDLVYDPESENIQLGDAYIASFGAQDGLPPSGKAFFLIGTNNLSAGAGPGTYFGFNTPASFTGDLLHFQVGNQTRLRATQYGDIIIRSGTMTGPAPILNLQQTWDNASATFTAIDLNVINSASAATSNLLDLRVDGSTRFAVRSDGSVHPQGAVVLPGDPTSALHAATRQYVDNAVAGASVSDVWINESGDAMTGTLDMGSNLVTNIGSTGTDFTSGGGLTLAGALSTGAGAGTLSLRPASQDHVYIQFFADTAAPSTRSGWMGYGSPGSTVLTIDNEIGTTINLVDAVTANSLTLAAGATVNEFSTDTAMSGNSNTAVPTEAAVRAYVLANAGSQSPWTNDTSEVYIAAGYPSNVGINGSLRLGSGTAGNATGAGDLYVTSDIEYDGNLYGAGADLAENIPADADYEPGTVLVIGEDGLLTRSVRAYDARVAGVVTTAPGIVLGKDVAGVPVALAGRVPVLATTENGPIRPGDLLTTATAGHAMRLTLLDPEAATSMEELAGILSENDRRKAAVVGKAIQGLRSGSGTIEMLVTLG